MKPEHVGHDAVELLLLPALKVAALGRLEKVLQTYNLIAHEVNTAARIY